MPNGQVTDWRTSELSLAAFLALHFDIQRTCWEGRSHYWYFLDSPELADHVADYMGGEVEVDLKAHSRNVMELKNQMFRSADRESH